MTGSRSPEQLELLMAGYVLCDLSPEEATELEQLLAENPGLRSQLATLQQTFDLAFATETAPPDHLRATVLRSQDASSPPAANLSPLPNPSARPVTPIRMARSGWMNGLGAAAAVVILGLGISNYWLWRSLQQAQTALNAVTTQPDEALVLSLSPTETNELGSVQVAIDPARLTGELEATNLPPLEAGQVYALWTVVAPDAPVTTDDKGAILTEVFQVDATGRYSQPITLPSVFRDRQLVQAMAITIEQADSPQRHRSAPLWIAEL